MDDIAFNWPKKILRLLFLVAFVVAGLWGLITGDVRNASDLLEKEITLISKPVMNRAQKIVQRIMRVALPDGAQPGAAPASPH